jgi:hypothetical protein
MSAHDDTPDPTRTRPPSAAGGASLPPDPPDDVEVEEPPPDPDSLRGQFRHPGVRNYYFTGLAALAMVFTVLFSLGSDIGSVLLVVIGAAGLVLRWPAAPPLFLLFLTYFLIFPFGLPDDLISSRLQIERDRFRIDHLLLIFSTIVFLACTYRVFGLTWQAVPHDIRFPKKSEKPTRRPHDLIVPGEIVRLLYVTTVVVVAGQVIWLLATALELDIGATIPVKLPATDPRNGGRLTELHPTATRLILLAGMMFFGVLLARLVFGYWRLRRMNPLEGRMVLQETGWDGARRERVRVEKWRIWGRKRAAERAKLAEAKSQTGGVP